MYNQKPLLGILPNFVHPLTPNVAAWIMNEGSGNKIFDLSGNKNHATLTSLDWVPNGLNGNASTDYALVPHSPTLNLSKSLTIIAHLNQNGSAGSYDRILQKGTLSTNRWSLFFFNVWNRMVFVRNEDDYSAPDDSFLNNSEHVVAVTLNNTKLQHYRDGLPIGSELTTAGDLLTNTNDLYLFNRSDLTRGWMGDSYYLFLYNWALSPSQISQLYINPYCWLAQPMEAELMYAAPPIGAIMNQFQKGNIGADLYDGVLMV